MTDNRLLIATNNAHKVTEFQRLLANVGYRLVTPRDIGLSLEVDETGGSFLANARLKAYAFARASGLPALADDSGIEVDALGGRPGVRSARYGGPDVDDKGRVQLLLRELEGVPEAARTCRYRVVLVLAQPDGSQHISVEGVCEGGVAFEPAGENGFGYDPIFFLPQYGRTVAQLSPAEKDAISHRGQAARAMAEVLRKGIVPRTHPLGLSRDASSSTETSKSEAAVRPLVDTLGRPVHDLRISVTDRCNFRCTYCMPAEVFGERYHFLPKSELLTYEEIARVARMFVDLGVRKLRITGGEPLVRQDVHKLVAMLAGIDAVEDLTVTTNGYLLAQHAGRLAEAGLRRITVSLDSLDPQVFGAMNGRGYGPERVLRGIAAAERAGLAPVKINSVIERGVNDHTAVELARRFKGTGHIVRFIEFMDVGNLNAWKMDRVVPSAELAERINAEMPIEPIGRAYRGEVAERWRYVDGSGEIGFISSVTQPFCGDCTRVRLSPEGEVYTCLFATSGHDLRTPLRHGADDDELRERIAGIWRARSDRYSELRASLMKEAATSGAPRRKVEMYHIGG